MSDYYVREEDGTSHYILEDESGDLILEDGFSTIERSVAIDGVGGFDVSGSGPFSPSRISQAPVEVVIAPTAAARVSQAPVEVVVAAVAAARASQVVAEIVVSPVVVEARASQVVAEVIVVPDDRALRLTAMTSEVIVSNRPENVNVVILEYVPDDA